MIPDLTGCFNYNPESNPLRGLSKSEINDFCFAYMKMWYAQEEFTDFNIMYDAGDAEMCADWLVGAGAIDSDTCYDSAKAIERVIEGWAKDFRKLGNKKRHARVNEVFDGTVSFACQSCNSVQFLNNGNEELYASEMKTCWDCDSDEIVTTKWSK